MIICITPKFSDLCDSQLKMPLSLSLSLSLCAMEERGEERRGEERRGQGEVLEHPYE
jgi:hypothetical protein